MTESAHAWLLITTCCMDLSAQSTTGIKSWSAYNTNQLELWATHLWPASSTYDITINKLKLEDDCNDYGRIPDVFPIPDFGRVPLQIW